MGQIIDRIKKNAEVHSNMLPGARHARLTNGKITISIVGGAAGLYGDFENTFEVAIIDNLSGEFVTKFLTDGISDDVIGYMPVDKLEELIEILFPKGFREA